MKNCVKILLFCTASVACISCDRVTKDMAKEHLKNQEPVSYFHNTIRLEYVENTGAALSLGDDLPKRTSFWLLSILPLIFLIALFAFTIKNAGSYILNAKVHKISYVAVKQNSVNDIADAARK